VSPWLILGFVCLIIYALWLLLAFVFTMLEVRHALMREERLRAADSRNNGREQTGEKVASG
jgi:hypothetical protein